MKQGNAETCQIPQGIAGARNKGIAKDERCAQKVVSERDVGKLELSALQNATLTLSSIYTQLITLKKKALGNHCGKKGNCSK